MSVLKADKGPEKKNPKSLFAHYMPEAHVGNLNFFRNIKTYLSIVKDYKLYVVGLLFLLILYQGASQATKYIISWGVDIVSKYYASNSHSWEAFRSPFVDLTWLFGACVLVCIFCKLFNMHLVNRLDAHLISDLKTKFFNHLVELSHNFHTSNKSGAVISKLTRGSNAIVELTDVIIYNFLPLVFNVAYVIITLLFMDKISAVVIMLVCVVYIWYGYYIINLQKGASLVATNAEDQEKAAISDFFTNIETIKYFGKENVVKSSFAKIVDYVRQSLLKNWDYFRVMDFGLTLILFLGIAPIVYFWIDGVSSKTITVATISYVLVSYITLEGSLSEFVQGIRHLYNCMTGFESLFQYLEVKNDIVDLPNAKKLVVKKGAIKFDKITFTYPGKKKPAIINFNLDIKPNMDVAIVGPSGAGKSTLIRLIFRLYNLDSGRILIDNQDIKECRQESLRTSLSIVPQDCVLFDTTIYDNILFSRPDASDGEVQEAIKFAQLHKALENKPYKADTVVGERGMKVAGGERQRISIARAFLAGDILILDEATSSLDSQTENDIQKALKKLKRGRTTITIAHRLSTIMDSDLIVVMNKGRIVSTGKHETLLKKNALYKKMWKLQKRGYIR